MAGQNLMDLFFLKRLFREPTNRRDEFEDVLKESLTAKASPMDKPNLPLVSLSFLSLQSSSFVPSDLSAQMKWDESNQ